MRFGLQSNYATDYDLPFTKVHGGIANVLSMSDDKRAILDNQISHTQGCIGARDRLEFLMHMTF